MSMFAGKVAVPIVKKGGFDVYDSLRDQCRKQPFLRQNGIAGKRVVSIAGAFQLTGMVKRKNIVPGEAG